MNAVAIEQYGGRDQLRLMELPDPQPGPGEVRVRIRAAGVNPVDAKIREGRLRTRLPAQFPIILGWDMAGVVETPGPGATCFAPGDEVFAYCRKPVIAQGAYAELICLPESVLCPKPETWSFEEAASLPLAGLTAWQSLATAGGLRAGQTALIHAAAGGVGGLAVQIARARGARVIATAGPDNLDYVRGLGAEAVIDYRAEDFRDAVRRLQPEGVDLAFDTVGGEVQARSAEVVKSGGVLVSILAFAHEDALRARGIRTRYVFVAPQAAQLALLKGLAESGRLRTTLAAVLPLAEAARAHERIETGHTRGKIVLAVG